MLSPECVARAPFLSPGSVLYLLNGSDFYKLSLIRCLESIWEPQAVSLSSWVDTYSACLMEDNPNRGSLSPLGNNEVCSPCRVIKTVPGQIPTITEVTTAISSLPCPMLVTGTRMNLHLIGPGTVGSPRKVMCVTHQPETRRAPPLQGSARTWLGSTRASPTEDRLSTAGSSEWWEADARAGSFCPSLSCGRETKVACVMRSNWKALPSGALSGRETTSGPPVKAGTFGSALSVCKEWGGGWGLFPSPVKSI